MIRRDRGATNTREDRRETDVVQKADLDIPVALDRLRYLALTMRSLSVTPFRASARAAASAEKA